MCGDRSVGLTIGVLRLISQQRRRLFFPPQTPDRPRSQSSLLSGYCELLHRVPLPLRDRLRIRGALPSISRTFLWPIIKYKNKFAFTLMKYSIQDMSQWRFPFNSIINLGF